MDDLMNFVASVGFPIVVTFYLLTRIEGKLDTLSINISQLSDNIARINDK